MKKIKLGVCFALVLGVLSCDKEEQVNEPILDDSSEVVDFEALGFESIKDEDVIQNIGKTSRAGIRNIYKGTLQASTGKYLSINGSGTPSFSASGAGPKEIWFLVRFTNNKLAFFGSNYRALNYGSNPNDQVDFNNKGASEWDLGFNGRNPQLRQFNWGFRASHGRFLEYRSLGSDGRMTSNAFEIDRSSGMVFRAVN